MRFFAKGHENLLATHKNTFEFTKDSHLTKNGDCIVGVSADFDTAALSAFAKTHAVVKITLIVDGLSDVVIAKTNPDFIDTHELVVRIGEHASPRTFAVRADKAAKHLNREMVRKLQQGSNIEVQIEPTEQN